MLGIANSYSQTTIAVNSFEVSGDTWIPLTFSTPPCTVGNDVWNYSTSIGGGFTPNDGNQFWGIRDLDGSCGGSGFETISFPNVNISANSGVTFEFDYNARNFDNNEDLKYELFYDNVSQGEVIVVNGVGGNSDNTNGWLTETVAVPNTVTNIRVILSARCNAGNERAGFDNVILKESAVPNDVCANAIPLTVYANGASSGNELAADTSLATSSSMSNTTCDSFTSNGNLDLFYTFTVPTGQTTVNVLTAGSNGATINVAVWDACNGNELICQNNNASLHTLTGLTSGTTYILQVWHDDFNAGPFNIALESNPPPPANNDCPTGTNLVVGINNTQNVITGTTTDATDSGASPTPTCGAYNGDDVWFTAVVPANGVLIIETSNAGSGIDTAIAAYSGACNALVQLACNDDINYPSNLFSQVILTGIPNTTVRIRVWAWNNSSSGAFNIVAYSPDCPFSTTWNGSSWNNGAPNNLTSSVLNANYDTATNGSFETCDCTINSGSTVNIRSNNYITVHNDLTINGSLEVRHQGSLVMTNDDGVVSVPGTFNAYKSSTSLVNIRDFTYWSSPVSNATISNVFSAANLNRVFYWDQSADDDGPGGDVNDPTITLGRWFNAIGSMLPAKGYISEGPTGGSYPQIHDIQFSGIPNNGEITLSGSPHMVFNSDSKIHNDYNLVGNPYPSAIDADEFLNLLSNRNSISGTLWLWTHNTQNNGNANYQYNTDDYASYNLTGGIGTNNPSGSGSAAGTGGPAPTGIIASGQGFMVRSIAANPSVTFNDAMRVETGNNQFFSTEELGPDSKNGSTVEKDRIWLNVESSEGGAFNQLLIGFFEEATDGLDWGYDGLKNGANWLSFYSKIDSLKYAIQGLSSFDSDKQVNLGFDTYIPDALTYTISIAKLEGVLKNTDVYLVDNLLEITHDLKQSDYQFDIDGVGNFPDRFKLQFTQSVLGVDEVSRSYDFILSNSERALNVRSNTIIKNIKAYDISGRLLIDLDPNKTEFNINTRAIKIGTVLLVQATLENQVVLSKKLILTK